MKRNTAITIGVVVLILIVLGVVVMGKKADAPMVPVATSTATTSVSVASATTTITVDWSKLEKDTIYTEEEGKYENLPPEGKELLRQLVGNRECERDPNSSTYCSEHNSTIKFSSIISLKNGILLYSRPSGKGVRHFVIYDLKKQSKIGEQISIYGLGIRSNKTIVLEKGHTRLIYYRPKMENFKDIPDANILGHGELFTEGDGFGATMVGRIINEKLSISVFVYDLKTEKTNVVREITIDLSTLP